MALPPKKDHRISLAEAAELTRKHRKDHPQANHGGFFHRDAFEALLKQAGCAGIRVYHGKGPGGESHLVLVGVDGNGDDMTGEAIMEREYPCPPYCSTSSDLLR